MVKKLLTKHSSFSPRVEVSPNGRRWRHSHPSRELPGVRWLGAPEESAGDTPCTNFSFLFSLSFFPHSFPLNFPFSFLKNPETGNTQTCQIGLFKYPEYFCFMLSNFCFWFLLSVFLFGFVIPVVCILFLMFCLLISNFWFMFSVASRSIVRTL